MKSLFRYSGNKSRLFNRYRPPPDGTHRLVEPYLGSGSYSLNHCLPVLGFDLDKQVVDLWHWLQEISPEDLSALEISLAELKGQEEKPDIRDKGFSRGELLYLKINVCGAYVGQWSSWKVYPQHNLPVARTLAALPDTNRFEVRHGPASTYVPQEGDAVFLDPPYIGTAGNYGKEKGYSPDETLDLISRCQDQGVPVMITYGDGADKIFPDLSWELVKVRKVPNLRRGGTTERREYVAYVGWPLNSVLDLFS